MSFKVDPDALTAASRLANRQDEHITHIDRYIDSACSNFGAFSGVLMLFKGGYESAVSTAHTGLGDSKKVAAKVRDAFTGSRDDYLETDRTQYDRFRALSPNPASFPPYNPAGSGNSSPGGPLENPERDTTKVPELDNKAPGVKDFGEKGADQVLPGGKDDDLPPWADPKGAANDAMKDAIQRRTDEYQYYRSLGYSDEEALEFAKTDSPTGRADTYTYENINRRAEDAYYAEYNRQIEAGASHDDAVNSANGAYADSRSRDGIDHDRRQGIGETVGTYTDLYDEAKGTIDGVKDLVDNVGEIRDNVGDINEYNDYESQDEDTSAQDWANS